VASTGRSLSQLLIRTLRLYRGCYGYGPPSVKASCGANDPATTSSGPTINPSWRVVRTAAPERHRARSSEKRHWRRRGGVSGDHWAPATARTANDCRPRHCSNRRFWWHQKNRGFRGHTGAARFVTCGCRVCVRAPQRFMDAQQPPIGHHPLGPLIPPELPRPSANRAASVAPPDPSKPGRGPGRGHGRGPGAAISPRPSGPISPVSPLASARSRSSSSRCTGRGRGPTCRARRSRTACSHRTGWSCRPRRRR
jgi:hypothetical protein